MNLDSIRRALNTRGLTAASGLPEASGGRMEEATVKPARLVEDDRLRAIPVGASETWQGSLAYLHGIQRYELVGYAGASPIFVGEVAAAVKERRDRRLHTILKDRRLLAIGRPAALASAGDALRGLEPVHLPDHEPVHPIRDLLCAVQALDRARRALEIEVGNRYRDISPGWLLIDRSLGDSSDLASDPRVVAVCKSHSSLPFEGKDLELYLRLPPGHRSSVYALETRSGPTVLAWGLRLWPWDGKDLLYGLVRIEIAPTDQISRHADLLSRWVLGERSPVSAPDRRWDRLLYGIYSVEQYLKAETG